MNTLLSLFLSHNVDSIISALTKLVAKLQKLENKLGAKIEKEKVAVAKALARADFAKLERERALRVAEKIKELVL